MQYLKLRRSRAILLWFAILSVLLAALPGMDLYVSRIFFHQGFHLSHRWWSTLMHEALTWLLCLSMGMVLVTYAFNKLWNRSVLRIDGRRVVYLLLVLIVGAGLIVNLALKDNMGRARPRDIAEFGGQKRFTPPFVRGNECDRNCSFASGEAAGGFFGLALAMALSRRRTVFVSAVVFGAFVSFCRIASGAHFLSDTVVSFFVMLLVADVFHYYLLRADAPRARQIETAPIEVPP